MLVVAGSTQAVVSVNSAFRLRNVSSNLTSWQEVLPNLATATPFQYTDTNANAATNRFCRVRLTP
jgi:allantoicase